MKDKILLKIAFLLPKTIVYWCGIRLWANATETNNYGDEASTVTVADAIKRFGYE